MNVADGVPVLSVTVVGENVPPPPPSLGVMMTPLDVLPPGLSVLVKLLDAAPTVPVDGPVRVVEVAAPPPDGVKSHNTIDGSGEEVQVPDTVAVAAPACDQIPPTKTPASVDSTRFRIVAPLVVARVDPSP